MSELTNIIQNNALAALTQNAPQYVLGAIKEASTKTGVNFAYLVQQAGAESSFNPTAKAKTSSASGLYQFIESTWLSMVGKHGESFGLKTEGKSRAEILRMRNDPKAASFMAAAFASENEKFLNTHWGGKVGSTELYFAHFLGAPKAAAFLKARDENPMQEAALLFPKAAKANRNVFYDTKTGRVKTLDEVYAFFDKKFSVKDAGKTFKQSVVASKTLPSKANMHYALVRNIRPSIPSFQNLVANPLELILLAQMDLPVSDKDGKFQLFSSYSLLK